MDDSRACRHPLQVSRVNNTGVANAVGMFHLTSEHKGHGFDATMRL
jgi:hypothetical protein